MSPFPRYKPLFFRFVLLSVFTLIKTTCPKIWGKLLAKNEKSPLPVDVRRSKMFLLKLPTGASPETIPEFFAKVNSAQSSSRFLSGEFSFFLPIKVRGFALIK